MKKIYRKKYRIKAQWSWYKKNCLKTFEDLPKKMFYSCRKRLKKIKIVD